MNERKAIDDFDRSKLEDGVHYHGPVSKVVRHDLKMNAWHALAFLWPLALWVIVMSSWCCFGRGDWQPQFLVNKLIATVGTPTVEPFGASVDGFLRALYYNTAMLSSVGASDFTPFNTASRAVSLLDSIAGVVTLGLVVSLLALSFEQKADGPSPGEAGGASSPDRTKPKGSGPDGLASVATGGATGASDPSVGEAVGADAARGGEDRDSDTLQAARELMPDDVVPGWQEVALWGWHASIASRVQSLADRMKTHIVASKLDKSSENGQGQQAGTAQEDSPRRVEVPIDLISSVSGLLFDLQSLPDRNGALALTLELNQLLIASNATVDRHAIDLAEADATKIDQILHRAEDLATAYCQYSTIAGNAPARRRKFL